MKVVSRLGFYLLNQNFDESVAHRIFHREIKVKKGMFSQTRIAAATTLALAALSGVNASHLDDVDGVFSNFSFDLVKFKTQTNCSLDKYPEVSSHI